MNIHDAVTGYYNAETIAAVRPVLNKTHLSSPAI
jgi:hypothetical protein